MAVPLKTWLLAARPRTLPAAVSPVLIGAAMAYADGSFHGLVFAITVVCATLIQIGTNFANDYFDFVKGTDTAERLGPVRATQAGLVAPAQMKRATAIVLGLAFLVGLFLVWRGGLVILIIGLLAILFAVLYTGGPFPLGYIGLGDVFVFFFFGPVAVAGAYYLQTLLWSPLAMLAGIAPGLLSMAILAVNNLRDADGDARSGKRTLAVRFGKPFAQLEYVACVVVALLAVPLWVCFHADAHWSAIAASGTIVAALPLITRVYMCEGRDLNAVLGGTGQLLLLYSIIFSLGYALW